MFWLGGTNFFWLHKCSNSRFLKVPVSQLVEKTYAPNSVSSVVHTEFFTYRCLPNSVSELCDWQLNSDPEDRSDIDQPVYLTRIAWPYSQALTNLAATQGISSLHSKKNVVVILIVVVLLDLPSYGRLSTVFALSEKDVYCICLP